jgi:hypothetical protein
MSVLVFTDLPFLFHQFGRPKLPSNLGIEILDGKCESFHWNLEGVWRTMKCGYLCQTRTKNSCTSKLVFWMKNDRLTNKLKKKKNCGIGV